MRTKIAPILTALSLLATHLFLALVVVALPADATPQTVGDEACPKYAVDIESFATCEGDRVVKPTRITLPIATREALPIAPRVLVDDEGNPLPSSVDAIPKRPARTNPSRPLPHGTGSASGKGLVKGISALH